MSVIWLYNRTGDASLLDLARLLHEQGTDWKRHFAEFPFTAKTTSEQLGVKPGGKLPDRAMLAHGVNNAMALKTNALWSFVSGDPTDRDAIHRALGRARPLPRAAERDVQRRRALRRPGSRPRASSSARWWRRSSRCST